MPCHGCATNFSLFVKEHTCPYCKFSFCNKCLKGKVNRDGECQKTCSNCSKKITSETSPSAQHLDPPGLLLKSLETLENPAKPPITIFKQKDKLLNLKAGLAPEDRQIVERLEKLKEKDKIASPPSESELNRRLMRLKGLNDESNSEKHQIIQYPVKSEQEEVNDLLEQYVNEMTLEGKINEGINKSLEDIKERVQKLATNEHIEQPSSSALKACDGDFVSKKMIQKAIAEGKLEKRLEQSCLMSEDDDDDDNNNGDNNEDEDEEDDNISVDFEETTLQWCIICNEDASLKCIGCDGNLYCNTCFEQGHEFFQMENHKTVKFM